MSDERRPAWWLDSRSLYCPASGGAGSALMSFGLRLDGSGLAGMELDGHLESFDEIPRLLDEARALGSNAVYLVDYWEGGYLCKGDYVPRADMGGAASLRRGVDAIHAMGGRIILYLEAFIVSREASETGRRHGRAWAMMSYDGSYQTYQGDSRYYQMWPGRGSGWPDYLAELAGRMTAELDVGGFHLDSCGCQGGWADHHPEHSEGREPGEFDARGADLVRLVRESVRSAKPEAIVILEGSDREHLLAVCDGSQDWSLSELERKSWIREQRRKVFTSEYGLPAMQRILAGGHSVSLGSWWLGKMPDKSSVSALARVRLDPRHQSWTGQWRTREPVRELWWCYDYLVANGLVQPDGIELEWLRRCVPPFPAPCDPYVGTRAGRARWREAVSGVLGRFVELDPQRARTPADYLRAMIRRAEAGVLAV